MAKTKQEEIAKEVLKANSFINTVYVTSDNKPFSVISDAENYAAKRFENAEERKLNKFKREDLKVKADVKAERKVSHVVAEIKKADTVEAVKALLENEHRPFVLKTAEKRIEVLSPSEPTEDASEELEALRQENAELKTAAAKSQKALKSKDAAIKKLQEKVKETKPQN